MTGAPALPLACSMAPACACSRHVLPGAPRNPYRAALPMFRSGESLRNRRGSRGRLARRGGLLDDLKEGLMGDPLGDVGSWQFSPEWFGTQGGGWGRDQDAGRVVFSEQSGFGNGEVQVTAHESTSALSGLDVPAMLRERLGEDALEWLEVDKARLEWRVLRFNEITRQSVASCLRVPIKGLGVKGGVPTDIPGVDASSPFVAVADPCCVPFEYVKTMVAVIEAWRGAAGLPRDIRVACLGLGGGTLPLFLAHRGAQVEGVDIDPAVVRAAQSAMGLAGRIAGLSLTVTSAEDFLSRSPEGTFDAVAVDLFDGADAVPRALTDAQSDLLRAVASAVHPERGLVVVNRHSGPRGGNGILGLGGQGAGYEVSSPAGAAVRATGEALLDAMGAGGEAGCFTVKALRHRQQNVCVACVRGGLATGAGLQDALTDGLARSEREAGPLGFDGAARVKHCLSPVGPVAGS